MLGEKYSLPMERVREHKVKCCNRHALLSGDYSEINKLYADAKYRFSFLETCIYQAGRLKLSRSVARTIFERRYKNNSRRFSQ